MHGLKRYRTKILLTLLILGIVVIGAIFFLNGRNNEEKIIYGIGVTDAAQQRISEDLREEELIGKIVRLEVDKSPYANCEEGFCDFYSVKIVVNKWGDNLPGSITKTDEGKYILKSLL